MDRAALERIDSFPYRHRVADVMSGPAVTISADATIAEAVTTMRTRAISSLLIPDAAGRPAGILTERDVLTAIAGDGAAALDSPVGDRMSSPVVSLPADSFVFTAIARMDRLGIRHLAVTDMPGGKLVGVVSARALLRQRAGTALVLGDEIAEAQDGPAMARVHARLPELAGALLVEKAPVLDLAAVVSAVLCDISARAAALAEAAMAQDGLGSAPAPWCFLVLGSAGRGESLLSADQDNAIVHAGNAADDPWYAELGTRAADLLDAAGIPYCRGKVMASSPSCRGTLEDWRGRIAGWVEQPTPRNLLNVDIFYDFRPVYGDHGLAEELRRHAVAAARASRPFLSIMTAQLAGSGSALGWFGRITTENGRADLKRGGTLPIVSGARVLALACGSGVTSTAERLRVATEAGKLNGNDAEALTGALELLMELVLEQQILDLGAGREASPKVEVKRLAAPRRARLKAALRTVEIVDEAVRAALTGNG